jgi:hypothetical protein
MSGSDTLYGLCIVRNLINNEHGKVHPWCGSKKGEFFSREDFFSMTYGPHNE